MVQSVKTYEKRPQGNVRFSWKSATPRPFGEDLRWRAIPIKEMLGYQDDEVAPKELWNASIVLACVAGVQSGGRGKVKFEREVRRESA